jgi:hypothetical protein
MFVFFLIGKKLHLDVESAMKGEGTVKRRSISCLSQNLGVLV